MRIFLNGIGAFGLDVFARLREAGEEVVAVASPPLSLSGRPDRLRAAAEEAGVPFFDVARLREPEVESALREFEPDLGVMAFVQEIIPRSVLELARHGTVQYHPSLLPRHRGRSAINWAIIQGETITGVSIFWPDEGVDTGPLLLQREVAIGPDDTAGSLYYEKLYPLGLDLLVEAAALVKAGQAPRIAQDESAATYERPCEGSAARIDWRLPLSQVYNQIRGCDPSPGAWTRTGERSLRVLEARPLPGYDAEPGIVAAVSADGVVIGAAGGAVLARKLQAEGPAAAAAQVAAEAGIAAGTRFLNPRRA
jgi:methionyl-tRNA formyltransferase